MKKLPKELYVQIETTDNESWFNAQTDAKELNDGVVGIYKLLKTVNKATKVIISINE